MEISGPHLSTAILGGGGSLYLAVPGSAFKTFNAPYSKGAQLPYLTYAINKEKCGRQRPYNESNEIHVYLFIYFAKGGEFMRPTFIRST